MNRDLVAWLYFRRQADDVPIRQANAAVASCAADGIRLVGAVDADAFFVEGDPHHAHGITRSRRKQMKIAAPRPMLEHLLVITEGRHFCDASHFPFANWRGRLRGSDRARVGSDELIALKHPEHVDFGVDPNRDRRWRCSLLLRLAVCIGILALLFGLIFGLVRSLRVNVAARLDLLYCTELEGFDIWDHQLIAGFDRFHFAWIEMLEQMNVAVEFFSDGIGRIAIRKKFQFGLRGNAARQCTDARQISICHSIGDEYRTYAVEIESSNVRGNIGFTLAVNRRDLGLLAARLAIERKRFPGELVVSSVNFPGAEVGSIEKDLQPSGCFNIWLLRSFLAVLSRCRWSNATPYQGSD